jgi:hypothetical protein
MLGTSSFAVLAAAVTLASVAAAGPDAAKQRVAITVTILPSGKGRAHSAEGGSAGARLGRVPR